MELDQERTANRRFDQKRIATDCATHLTPTQRKVLEGVHRGLLNKQIAFNLGIAEATVKAHMTALMRKLNVRNRTQVAILAQSLNQPERDHVDY